MLIHGLPGSRNKNIDEPVIDTVKEKMLEEIKKDEIDQSHRLGTPKNNGKSGLIIIKFARHNIRWIIFKHKKNWREKYERNRKFEKKAYGSR